MLEFTTFLLTYERNGWYCSLLKKIQLKKYSGSIFLVTISQVIVDIFDPLSRPTVVRPVVITIFHVCRPYLRPYVLFFQNLSKQNKWKQWSPLAWLWDWPRGSLMAHVLCILMVLYRSRFSICVAKRKNFDPCIICHAGRQMIMIFAHWINRLGSQAKNDFDCSLISMN